MRKIDRPDETAKHLAEGEAAFVLLESLLLTLIGKGVLSADEVVATVENVVDVKLQLAADGTSPELSRIAAGLLVKVANSIAAADRVAAPDPIVRESGVGVAERS